MMGPGKKLVRIALRFILWTVLSWFLLLFLWCFLPSPLVEQEGDNGFDSTAYVSRILRAGKTLTRVYEIPIITDDAEHRHAFALDYKLHTHNFSLSISGTELALSNPNATDAASRSVDVTQNINVTARVGDADGANLPWFPFADSILLFWWIHQENAIVPVRVIWVAFPEEDRPQRVELWSTVRGGRFQQPLLTIDKESDSASSVTAMAPTPRSSSPSLTYPLRVAIIYVLAPTAVFINDLFGDRLASIFKATLFMVFCLFVMLGCVLSAIVVIIVLRFCLGRRSVGIGKGIQNRLQRVDQNGERLLRIVNIRRWPNQRQTNERISETVNPGQAKYDLSCPEDKNTKRMVDIEKGA